jgi:hypothetical protein
VREYEYVGPAWPAHDSERIKGWNVDGVLAAYQAGWPEFVRGLAASYALEHAPNALPGSPPDAVFHNLIHCFGYVLARAAWQRAEISMLDWGGGLVKSKNKDNAIRFPLAVLVNRDTSGSAEALAAVVREAGVGLILGGRTAGGGMIKQEFSLKNGQRLRIATSPVKLGDGSTLSAQGLKPDIEVAVNLEDERAYRDDAYAILPKAGGASVLLASPGEGTNRPSRRRISEADLVRERREGTNINTDDFTALRDREPEKPMIRDPALARAVDLLKGLAVVRRARS